MSNPVPTLTIEQVYPEHLRLRDDLEYAIRRLHGTRHAAGTPHTLGDDMLRCKMLLSCSQFLPQLEAQRPAFIQEATVLLREFGAVEL